MLLEFLREKDFELLARKVAASQAHAVMVIGSASNTANAVKEEPQPD